MAKIDARKLLVTNPLHEVGANSPVKHTGHQNPSQTYMSNALVPGSNAYVEVSWIWDVPSPNPYVNEHSHNFDEIVMHIGSNPDDPEDLGGEIEIGCGGQTLTFDKTSALFLPRGTKHGPLVWKKVTRPHLEMTIMLGCGDFARAMPGQTVPKK
jgi:hypothetical protein